jgi:hypothetical protein
MQLTGHITPESLMTLEAYTKWRKVHKPEVIAHRKLRSVQLGDHVNLQFESETTIRYQIQEMLRIEKIFEEEGIQDEIEAYAPLLPDGTNWKATMMLEYTDDRENDEKTSAVHFVRFEFNAAMCAAIKAGASVKLGCDHTNYPSHVEIAADTLASLAGDIR